MTSAGRRTRVLFSVRGPSSTTNPYVVQLGAVLQQHVDVAYFSWRRGLFGRYDVLHVHWPEVMLRRAGRAARAVAQLRFTLLMLRLEVTATPVVRTLHNPRPHDSTTIVERVLLRWCDRRTRYWILLNPTTPRPLHGQCAVIPHGHYEHWYRGRPTSERVEGRLLCFGLFRPYKGVEHLLDVFARIDDRGATLRLIGRPASEELRERILRAVELEPRAEAILSHVGDDDLSREITASQLVVLPYRAMHNSGAVLLALSLRRPVLVPRNRVNVALAEEVGPEWVQLFNGDLTTADVEKALAATTDLIGAPDLRTRDWATAVERHVAVYSAL